MATLKLGSKGKSVAELQARLRELGFDAEGSFGTATEAAVVAFQERHGLLPDGIVGPRTREALAEELPPAARPPGALEVDRNLRLADDRYLPEAHVKDLIVLHHTAGASARSTFNFWNGNAKRIATAFIVERDGTIFEVFDPRHWAFHLGLQGTQGRVDRRSIGIEIASEGGLTEKDGALFEFDKISPGTRFPKDKALELEKKWRGYRFFARYTTKQAAAVCDLVNDLCDTFKIARRTPANHLDFDRALWDYQGIVGHHHLREDKSDVHPGFDWDGLQKKCKLTLTS